MATAIGTYATRTKVAARIGTDVALTTAEQSLLDTLCDQINDWIEHVTGRVLAPRPETTLVLDGIMAENNGRVLPIPWGINSLTTLEVASQTGGTFETIASTDWLLRPLAIARKPGWPATHIVMSDVQQGSVSARIPSGYGNVRLTGAAGFLGWPAIPDEIAELGTTAVVRAWAARGAGQADILGTDEYGRPIVSRYLSRRDLDTLGRYSIRPKAAGGVSVVWGG